VQPKKLRVPSVVHHKATDQDCVFLRDAEGQRRMVYLGKHGSPEAARRFREVLAEHFAGRPVSTTTRSAGKPSPWPTVGHLCFAFLVHAERYYVDADGQATGEVERVKCAFAPLLNLLRDTPTDRVTIRDLLDVRQSLIDDPPKYEKGRKAPKGLCRRTINDRMHTIKRLFRWGVEQRLVPGATWHELSAMRGLTKGRSGVHDYAPVQAVPWAIVKKTIEHLTPTVHAAVLVQWHTGMRPGEVLSMTRRQMDTSGSTWIYRPSKHKSSWRGRERVVAIGPRAQGVLKPLLPLSPDAAVFSAQTAWDEFRQQKRAKRATPPTKQTRDRDARAATAAPVNEFLGIDEYRRALTRACDRAGIPHWSPHRLRHAAGTRIAEKHGIEAARAALGHADLATTRRYASGADEAIARDIASRLG